MPLLIAGRNRNNMEIVAHGRLLPSLSELGHMTATFVLTCFAWIFFRADSMYQAFHIITRIFSGSFFTVPALPFDGLPESLIGALGVFIAIEWHGREHQYGIASLGLHWKRPIRHALYYALLAAVFMLGGREQQFIYFQF